MFYRQFRRVLNLLFYVVVFRLLLLFFLNKASKQETPFSPTHVCNGTDAWGLDEWGFS